MSRGRVLSKETKLIRVCVCVCVDISFIFSHKNISDILPIEDIQLPRERQKKTILRANRTLCVSKFDFCVSLSPSRQLSCLSIAHGKYCKFVCLCICVCVCVRIKEHTLKRRQIERGSGVSRVDRGGFQSVPYDLGSVVM